MMAIGNNFFYTRSLPCILWFFDRANKSVGASLAGAPLASALDPAPAQNEKGHGQPGQAQGIAPTIENMALLCKALRKPQDKLIKQLLNVMVRQVKLELILII